MYKTPLIKDVAMQRILDELYRALNEVATRVPSTTDTPTKSQSGEVGGIKIVKTEPNKFELSVKTDEGFVKTNMTFKE